MNRPRKTVKQGLYALTPTDWPDLKLLAAVKQAIAGGATLIQYRDKPRPGIDLARKLAELCRAAGIGLIINDDVDLARSAGAAGVHLGRDDQTVEQARAVLGPQALIGVSCYNDLNRARKLAEAGADYLAFGSVFASTTKPEAVHCPLDVLTRAGQFGKPIVAIGGVTAENAPRAIAAGADLVAVITDLFNADDIEGRARAYTNAFSRSH